MSLDSADGFSHKDILSIRSGQMLREGKKSLKRNILPINPNYPADVTFKIGTVFPRKNISKKYKIPLKTAKALIVYITII